MIYNPYTEMPKSFAWKDLHKKSGTFIYCEPTDSDINEGFFMEQLWFMDTDYKQWLIMEKDVREEK